MSSGFQYVPKEAVDQDMYDRLWLVASPTGTDLSVRNILVHTEPFVEGLAPL